MDDFFKSEEKIRDGWSWASWEAYETSIEYYKFKWFL